MKKGFTVIELIISITLILIVGTSTTLFIIDKKKNKDLENVTNKILNAANLYIQTETDELGNTYNKGLFLGGNGITIPLKKLFENGYLDDTTIKTLENNGINQSEYILAAVFADSSNQCSNSENVITFEASWSNKLKEKQEVLYLCNYQNNKNNNSLFNELVNDYGGINNITEIEDIENSFNYTEIEDAGNGIDNAALEYFIYYSSPIHDGLYKRKINNSDDYYYRGNIENNYIKINTDSNITILKNSLFRIVSFNKDTIKIIQEKTISDINTNSKTDTPYKYDIFFDYLATLTYDIENSIDVANFIKTTKILNSSYKYTNNNGEIFKTFNLKSLNLENLLNNTNGYSKDNKYTTYNTKATLLTLEDILYAGVSLEARADKLGFVGNDSGSSNIYINNSYLTTGGSTYLDEKINEYQLLLLNDFGFGENKINYNNSTLSSIKQNVSPNYTKGWFFLDEKQHLEDFLNRIRPVFIIDVTKIKTYTGKGSRTNPYVITPTKAYK